MERYLPKGTLAHIAMPFFVPDDPLFIIIVTSRRPHYHFDVRDENIVRTMGSVLRAQALQARMIAADATKTAFLSFISHELRTPMHGVLTGLQLVREAVRRQEWDQLASLLGVAESSGKTLQHLLNDVLDFGSIGKKDQKESRTAEVDLARSAEEMAMACSTRMTSEGVGVDLIVEYEKRNWKAMIDEAGYHR
jgi:signal transduction histidine kinase